MQLQDQESFTPDGVSLSSANSYDSLDRQPDCGTLLNLLTLTLPNLLTLTLLNSLTLTLLNLLTLTLLNLLTLTLLNLLTLTLLNLLTLTIVWTDNLIVVSYLIC